MHTESLHPDDQKIIKLLHSGSKGNDLLAFEIIKNRPYHTSFQAPLTCIALTCKDKDMVAEIKTYLQRQLHANHLELFDKIIEKPESPWMYISTLKHYFMNEQIAGITYAHFQRTQNMAEEFLQTDDGTHPERAKVFEFFLNQLKPFHYDLTIPGLFPDEMDRFISTILPPGRPMTLYRLNVRGMRSDYLSPNLLSRSLREVQVSTATSFFPTVVLGLPDMKKLTLELHEQCEIPDDWSAASELADVYFSGRDRIFKSFSFIDHLPKLKQLSLGSNYIDQPGTLIHKKVVPIHGFFQFLSQKDYQVKGGRNPFLLPQKKAMSIAGALGKSILSQEEKEFYFKKILSYAKLKNIEALPLNDLLALMNVSDATLRSVLQTQLDQLSIKQKGIESLDQTAKLYIAGTPSQKKTEIKQKLKALGVQIVAKPEQEITHLLIGKSPKDYLKLRDRDLTVVSEQALYKMLKSDAPGFLEVAAESGDTTLSDNLLQFLYSDEGSNVLVGLEMLKTGGVTPDFIEPLLVVYKTCPDTKARGVAKKLLLNHAPADLLPIINDSQRFTNLHQKPKAQDINKKLEKMARTTSRALAAKLALLFHKRFKKGLRYVLYHFHEPCTERSQALQAMVEGTHFDFAAGLGFTSHKGKDPESIMLYQMKSGAKFPIDVANEVPLIETANFHNCKITSLPKNIGDLKDLKELDLSHNFLGSIPKSIEEMKKLEVLNLQMNEFKTFPMMLRRLHWLKTLDLRYNRVKGVFTPVEIPAEIREALKDCEILV